MTNEEAIELLKNMHWSITTKMNGEVPSSLALNMAIKSLEQPETNCSKIPNGWIPCSERLPEEGQEILATTVPNGWYDVVIIRSYYAMIHKSVIAWMPLPEPYKEGEQNG